MSIKLGVVMDALTSIHVKKDSTLAMLLEAQARGWELYFFEVKDLFLRDGQAFGNATPLQLTKNAEQWFSIKTPTVMPLANLNVILMRKDPPFNEEYIYSTYVLEQAERSGTLVVNRPQALRDANEKLFTAFFLQCSPPTLVTQSIAQLHSFWQEQHDIVCKPLNTMGGKSVFRLRQDDVNANVIFETLTQNGSNFTMAQRFIPEITAGDKRIILIDGEAIPHVLARVPQGSDWRGNLAAGAKGIVQPLSQHDSWICEQIGPTLRERGLYFVGIDIIGDYLTEINVTSPTGIREIDAGAKINIAGLLLDNIEKHLKI